jgi:hypothetical protein
MSQHKDLAKAIDEKITQRTGLTNPRDIEVYCHFCHHADFDNGIIMYGDVQHEIYEDLLRMASLPMRVLERAYNEGVGNNVGLTPWVDTRLLKSPLSKKAATLFQQYFFDFLKRDLVSDPEKFGFGHTAQYYPRLKSYNYFNDTEFYERSEDGKGRELVSLK